MLRRYSDTSRNLSFPESEMASKNITWFALLWEIPIRNGIIHTWRLSLVSKITIFFLRGFFYFQFKPAPSLFFIAFSSSTQQLCPTVAFMWFPSSSSPFLSPLRMSPGGLINSDSRFSHKLAIAQCTFDFDIWNSSRLCAKSLRRLLLSNTNWFNISSIVLLPCGVFVSSCASNTVLVDIYGYKRISHRTAGSELYLVFPLNTANVAFTNLLSQSETSGIWHLGK